MQIQSRPYQGEADFQKVRHLLIESYRLTQRIHNWWLDRWEGTCVGNYAEEALSGDRAWESQVRLWETDDGQVVGVVNPEDEGDIFLQIHPDYRHLENEMLDWAEAHHQNRQMKAGTTNPFKTFAYAYDQIRTDILTQRGYRDLGPCEYTRRRSLADPIDAVSLPPGYRIRHLQGEADLDQRAAVQNAAFNSTRANAETIRVLQKAPTYRLDLDLVVVAPDSSFAAFAVVWYGPENQLGWFEPVGTHPEHRRRGLARAIINEGLQRLKTLEVQVAYVGSGYDSPANRLYEATGFDEVEIWHQWEI